MPEVIHQHQWTNGGAEVLIVKCVPKDGTVRGSTRQGAAYSFAWPLTVGAIVEAPDFNPEPTCGGGLHGWPWGFSLGDGKEPDWSGTWIVFGAKPEDVIGGAGDLTGKCKARAGTIRYVGNWVGAMDFVLRGQMAWVHQAAQGEERSTGSHGAASSTGDRGAASSTGDRGAASSTGYQGAASSTGYRGAASSTGYQGAASSTGYQGAASSTGDRGAASSTGLSSASVVTGIYGRAQAGSYGCIALAWWNAKNDRQEMRCARVGCGDGSDGLLKAATWYRLNDGGEFVEDAS